MMCGVSQIGPIHADKGVLFHNIAGLSSKM